MQKNTKFTKSCYLYANIYLDLLIKAIHKLSMKNRFLFILLILFLGYPTCFFAQNARVVVPQSHIRVGELLSQIESQTEYLFVYNKRNVDVRRTVDLKTGNGTVAEILNEIFKGTDISYVMEGNNIVLTKSATSSLPASRNGVSIKGLVTDMKGDPIIGANVVEKGTNNGTVTNLDGHFNLEVLGDVELMVTYMGYKPQIVPAYGRTNFVIRLEEESLALETVVITAMGIKKKEASLTYSTQLIDGNELIRAKESNLINSLTGKTAGVQINRSSSGLGGSVKVNIRGTRSISGNNQPLYVIDGIPMLNSINEQANTILGGVADAGNRDGGDGISNLNPEDIESMSILKGATAAALYGTQAANGVILITTKKGKAGVQKATFSSSFTFDSPTLLPKFQNSYGIDNSKTSWGEKTELKDYKNVDNFYRTGVSAVNSFSFTRGNENLQTYFSYANTYGKGIIEGNSQSKHNINFRQTASFFRNRLTLDGNVNLIQQTIKNRPTTGGYYLNPLVGLYGFPRGQDLNEYREKFEIFDKTRNMEVQNWYTSRISGLDQNPYWLTNRVLSNDKRYRTIANLTANLKINDWLSLQARGTADYVSDKYKQKMYASTAADIAGTYYPQGSEIGYANGRYVDLNHSELLIYGDIMALFNKSWYDWSLNGALGASINNTRVNTLRLDSKTASLYYPNIFTVTNIVMSSNAYIDESIEQQREMQSVFATAQLSWKESVYLDVTGRNDWSSTLTFTANQSFFYPSVGLSWIMNNTINFPTWVSFGKVRASWAQVSNDLPLFYSRLEDKIAAGGAIQQNDRAPFDELKPELNTSIELGTEWKFFNQRLDLELTYYKTTTENQLLTLSSKAGAKYKFFLVNAGKIENQGLEVVLGATPVMTTDFRWKTSVNYSINKNKIIELHPALSSFVYGDEGFSMNYAMRLRKGGSFGDVYGWKFDRDENGVIKLDDKGLPLAIGSGNMEKVGNSNPNYMLGWNNTFTYKGFTLYALVDARVGGDVLSQTQAELDYRGVSANSGHARDKGYVEVGGQRFNDVEAFYRHIGARNSTITEFYMYDATNIRLRELSLGYSLPRSILEKTKILQGIDLSLIGRNLFFLYKKAPFDPDAVMSTDNKCQGVDVFGMPTSRSLGFNIKFTF